MQSRLSKEIQQLQEVWSDNLRAKSHRPVITGLPLLFRILFRILLRSRLTPAFNVCQNIVIRDSAAMPKDDTPTDADVIFNRANVALANSQRLVQSWLPTKTSQETQPQKTHQELLKEDEELFKPTPEL